MFAGHVGIALAAARAEPRINVGILTAAALLLDVLLWLCILIGWESVTIPANFVETHQPEFVFPYSHGLLTSVAWSALAGAIAFAPSARREEIRWQAGIVVAAVVFSHWLLDALVHRPELPIAAAGSRVVGLGLGNHMPAALAVEAIVVVVGLIAFLPKSGLPRGKRIAIGALTLLVLAFTVGGMTIAPPPPSANAMAASSLATIIAVCLLLGWLGKRSRHSSPARQR
jgi:hypothetical protein